MKKLILLIVLIPCLAQAQDITGQWNGILNVQGMELTGAMSEYATIGQTIDPVVLEEIFDWVLKQAK